MPLNFWAIVLILCTFTNISKPHKSSPCPIGLNDRLLCSGVGRCDINTGICHCPINSIGSACQYQRQLMTCTNQRHCVQCRVHGTGPFAEDNGCEELFCRDHPNPVVVDQLRMQEHEILCSFIDLTNATNICRFYFKLVNFPNSDKNEESFYNNDDVFIIAQRKPECEFNGGWQRVRDENKLLHDTGQGSGYAMFFMVIIAVPFVACMASCVQNFRSLPCGLCNFAFRKPSSAYLRHVRPYPDQIIENSSVEHNIVGV